MRKVKYIVYKDGEYFVSQCLNVDVSSFGKTMDEAVQNLKEAIELYLDDSDVDFKDINETLLGETYING